MQAKGMRASIRTGSSSLEEHVFFIYDREALKSEWDNPENAILFFLPNAVPVKDQCSLCGQLVGMVSFFERLLDSRPRVFKLKHGKFAIKCVENFVMALGGKLSDPDNLLFKMVSDMYSVFQFFHKSFKYALRETDCMDEIKKRMLEIWHCYVPFVKNYRQDALAFLDTIQYLDYGKYGWSTYLKAVQILEVCQRLPQVLCGCIISKEKIVASQIQPEVLRFLTFLRPSQDHIPISHINTDEDLPQGVRIYPVYVRRKAYEEIMDIANRTPYYERNRKQHERKHAKLTDNDEESCRHERRSDREDDHLSTVSKSISLEKGHSKCMPDNQDWRMVTKRGFNEDKDSGIFSRDLNISESCSTCDQEELIPRKSTVSSGNLDSSSSSNAEIFSVDWFKEQAMSESQDGSEIDAVLEKEFGGNLEDLKEGVRRFNLCYKEEDGTAGIGQSELSETDLCQSDPNRDDDVTPVDNDVTIDAYQEAFERIEKCIEGRDYDSFDDVKTDLTNQRTEDVATEGIIHEKIGTVTDIDSAIVRPTFINGGKIDNTVLNGNCEASSFSVVKDDNVSDETRMSKDSDVFSISSDLEHRDLNNSKNVADSPVNADEVSGKDDIECIEADAVSVTSTTSSTQTSLANDELLLRRSPPCDESCNRGDENEAKAISRHTDVATKVLPSKEGSKGEVLDESPGSRRRHKEGAFAHAVMKRLESEKLVAGEARLSGDDGYSSMDKGLDRQKSQDAENVPPQSADTPDRGWSQKTLVTEEEELVMLHLYVQSNSSTVLMAFLVPQSGYDRKIQRSIYEIVVAQLGDLELGVQHLLENSETHKHSEEFVYLTYNGDKKTHSGNCRFISQKDYTFEKAMESLHSQFLNSKTMSEAFLRDFTTVVYGKRTDAQETYYQPRGDYIPTQGAPSPYDESCVLDRKLNSKLRKDNVGVIL